MMMEKRATTITITTTGLVLFFSMMVAIPLIHCIDQEDPKSVQLWFQNLSHKKQTLTKLHFYFHDIWTGKTPTVTQVAQSTMTSKSPTLFGSISMMDDPLTVGPEPNSTIVGRAQGFYGSAAMEEVGLLMTMNLVFTSGDFNGSTLSVLGRNSALNSYREMPIVGGSGVFRLAQGVATAHTYWLNATTGDAIVEYNLLVLHY